MLSPEIEIADVPFHEFPQNCVTTGKKGAVSNGKGINEERTRSPSVLRVNR
jgi:hypothetical protein